MVIVETVITLKNLQGYTLSGNQIHALRIRGRYGDVISEETGKRKKVKKTCESLNGQLVR